MNKRLDVYLVENKFYDSRAKAAEAIKNGDVLVNDIAVIKPSAMVCSTDNIVAATNEFVSRAAKKLEYALNSFNISVDNYVAIDVGASTGGFTQVLLKHGAKKVFAIDVGTGQLSEKLATDLRVVNMQKTNFLDVDNSLIGQANIIVSDVSFVSQTKLVKKYAEATCPIIILIKPQFECGMQYAHKHKGIVKDKCVQKQCIENVVSAFSAVGLSLSALDVSPIYGGDGNKEFVALFEKKCAKILIDFEKIVEKHPELE